MSGLFSIQAALSDGEKLPAHKVAARVGISTKQFQRRIGKIVNAGHVSREKKRDSGSSFYRYFLDDQQQEAFKVRLALHRQALTRLPGAGELALVTETDEIHDRLKFLRMLKEKTVYADHAALARIIEDYERTLKLRRACEMRAENDDMRGRPRKTECQERVAA